MLIDRVEHHNVENKGVNIHYVSVGEGTVLLFVHGWPDFWYLWYNQLDALSSQYKCVAMEMRGTNLSGAPEGVENYGMKFFTSDINAVIEDINAESVTLIGHDAGGLVAWYFAMDESYKKKVNGLIIMNITHPRGFSRALEVATPELAEKTKYARVLKDPEQEELGIKMLDAAIEGRMKTWWEDKDPRVVELVKESSARINRESLLNFYRANYFDEPYKEQTDFPVLEIPVLQFHGLADLAVYKDGLSETWDWVARDYTLVTYPGVGHIPQLEVADKATKFISAWLSTR